MSQAGVLHSQGGKQSSRQPPRPADAMATIYTTTLETDQGTELVELPIWIEPADESERISALHLNVSIGAPADRVPFVRTRRELLDSIFPKGTGGPIFLSELQHHHIRTVLATLGDRIEPKGLLVTLGIATKYLPVGDYAIDLTPKLDSGPGTVADIPLDFVQGSFLRILPKPGTPT